MDKTQSIQMNLTFFIIQYFMAQKIHLSLLLLFFSSFHLYMFKILDLLSLRYARNKPASQDLRQV